MSATTRTGATLGGVGRDPGGPTDRGRAETVGGLVALAAVCVAVSLHAGVLADASPAADRDVAEPTLRAVHDRLTAGGVLDPSGATNATLPRPDGRLVNVTVAVDRRRLALGAPLPPGVVVDSPPAPGRANGSAADAAVRPVDATRSDRVDVADRRVPVRVAPGRVRGGRLRVVVWT